MTDKRTERERKAPPSFEELTAIVCPDEKNTKGRPTLFSKEWADAICFAVSNGMSLRKFCREVESAPNRSTVHLWMLQHPNFSNQYRKAKMESAEADHDHIDDMAERMEAGTLDPTVGINVWRIKTWNMAKKNPKRFSDRVVQEVTGSLITANMSDEELHTKLHQLISAALGQAATAESDPDVAAP